MDFPLQITFKGMEASPALEERIREKGARLARFASNVVSCHVTVEEPHQHHRQGRVFGIRVEIFVPRDVIVVTREGTHDHAHEDAFVAVRDAFDAAVRQIEDHVRRVGGRVKHHEEPLLPGRVSLLIVDGDYGFIETDEGEIYFHRNSVVDRFDRLRVGDPVRLAVAEGEKGLQASTVHRVGKPHDPD